MVKMVLIDKGLDTGMEFGHTDYNTGEGRFITHSENVKEKYVNPELTVKERHKISHVDTGRRNEHKINLHYEYNIRIEGSVSYNPANESLCFSWNIRGDNGKKVGRLN